MSADDGSMSYREFRELVATTAGTDHVSDVVLAPQFQAIDKDNDGVISPKELKQFAANHMMGISPFAARKHIDVSGAWHAVGNAGGHQSSEHLVLYQSRKGISGSSTDGCPDPFVIIDGKLEGERISFVQKFTDGGTTNWEATLSPDGLSLIDGRWFGEGMDGTFSATKAVSNRARSASPSPSSVPDVKPHMIEAARTTSSSQSYTTSSSTSARIPDRTPVAGQLGFASQRTGPPVLPQSQRTGPPIFPQSREGTTEEVSRQYAPMPSRTVVDRRGQGDATAAGPTPTSSVDRKARSPRTRSSTCLARYAMNSRSCSRYSTPSFM